MVDQAATMGTGQEATNSDAEAAVGAGRGLGEAVATRSKADRLSTTGPMPVARSNDRFTPVASCSAVFAEQQATMGSSGAKGAGTAQVRSTIRVAASTRGPREPRKSAGPSAVTSPPP